jgi:tRNA(Ile)-lysidine synthase
MSIEMAARKYRYVFLENLRIHENAKYILTAHHLDDRIETALFNLIRGTKLSGIHALAIVSNTLLRPLAAISKNAINQYALKN